MLDMIQNSWQFIAILSILSGVKVLLDHLLPKDSTIAVVLGKVVDFITGNTAH